MELSWGRGLTSASLGGDKAPSREVVSKDMRESWETGLPVVGCLAGLQCGPGVNGGRQAGGQSRLFCTFCS